MIKEYRIGDFTYPIALDDSKCIVIAHVVPDVAGIWKTNEEVAVRKRFKKASRRFANAAEKGDNTLGRNQVVYINDLVCVVNMIARHGRMKNDPIDFDALDMCLEFLTGDVTGQFLIHLDEDLPEWELHIGRFNTLHSGVQHLWLKVKALLEEHLPNIDIVVYDATPKQALELGLYS